MESSDSSDEDIFVPITTPVNKRGQQGTISSTSTPIPPPPRPTPKPPPIPTSASLPVQLTWKGVQIYFPSVVLKSDLKAIADEALAKRIAGETFKIPKSSSSHESSSTATTTTSGASTPRNSKTPSITSKKSTSTKTGSGGGGSDGGRRGSRSSSVASTTSTAKSVSTTFEGNVPQPGSSSGQLEHECGICHCTFHSDYALKRHSNAHTTNTNNKYGPCQCGAKFSKRKLLDNHAKLCKIANPSGVESKSDSLIRIKMESVEDLNKSTEAGTEGQGSTSNAEPDLSNLEAGDDGFFDVTPSGSEFHAGDDEPGGDDDQMPVVTSVSSIAAEALKCERCGSQFGLNIQFIHHKNRCEKMCQRLDKQGRERRFGCDLCPWRFLSVHELKRHRLIHEGARPFQCPICMEGFARKDYLVTHSLNCTPTPETTPVPASESQKLSTTAKPTVSQNLSKEPIVIPSMPDDNFDSSDDNESSHCATGETPTENENQSSSTSHVKNAFELMMPGSSSKPNPNNLNYKITSSGVECKICLRQFTGVAYLRQHACRPGDRQLSPRKSADNTQHNNQTFACPFCGVVFTKYYNVVRHMRKFHKCPKCGEDFKYIDENSRHVEICQEPLLSRDSDLYLKFKCHMCPDTLNPRELLRHLDTHHGKQDKVVTYPPKKAPVAAARSQDPSIPHDSVVQPSRPATTSASELGTSVGAAGPPQPPMFTCKFSSCTRFFSHDEDLWFHVDLKHRSVGNICCGQCGQDFKTEELVNEHEQKVHSPAAPEELIPSAEANQDSNSTSNQGGPTPRPKSPLSILSFDIARIIESSPLKSAPTPSLSKIPRNNDHLQMSAAPPPPIIPTPILRAAIKMEKEDQPEEFSQDNDGTSPFHENAFPDDDFNEDDDVPEPPPQTLMPILESTQGYPPFPEPVSNPNPFVFISARCKAMADEALQLQQTNSDVFSSNILEPSSSTTINPVSHSTVRPPVPFGLDYYCCTLCNDLITFSERDSYIQHLNEEHEEHPETFTCHVCSVAGISKIFYNRHAYRLHLSCHRRNFGQKQRSVIPLADEYFCSTCNNRKFTNRKLYINHLKYHSRLMKLKGYDGPCEGRGLRRHDIPDQSEYTCTECLDNRKFTNRQAYICHLNYHKRMRDKGFENGTIERQRAFRRTDVPVQEEYTCSECDDRKFPDRRTYIFHLNYHARMRQRGLGDGRTGPARAFRRTDIPLQAEYTCSEPDCGRSFTDRKVYICHVNYHMKLKEEKEKKLQRAANLRPDIPISPTGDYYCSTCSNREFHDRFQYVMHVRYHEQIVEREGQDRPIGTPQDRRSTSTSAQRPDIPMSLTGEYSCSTCNNRVFNDRHQYIMHVKYHEQIVEREGQDRPIITLADRKKSSSLIRKDIPFSDIYTCTTCDNREFTDRVVYLNHMNYHEILKKKGEDRPVGIGPTGAGGGRLLRPDIPLSDEYRCDLCEDKKVFTDRAQFLSHLNDHRRVQQKSFKSGKNWRRRQPGVGGINSWQDTVPFAETYKCDTCPTRTFTNRESYIGHINYHNLLQKKGCNRVIMSKEEWAQNKERQKNPVLDEEGNSYQCKICSDGRTFANRQSYNNHVTYHDRLKRMGDYRRIRKKWEKRSTEDGEEDSQDRGPPYTCSICENRSFSTRLKYLAHVSYHEKIRNQEGADRPIRSDWRLYRKRNGPYSQIPDLDEYTCEICNDGRTFTTKLSYFAHMSYHKKREQLGMCGPLRKRGAYLREDIPIQDIYTCERCPGPRTFEDRKFFVNHLNYHAAKDRQEKDPSSTSQQPIRRRRTNSNSNIPFQSVYRCKHCIHLNKTFTDRRKYKAHMNYHKYQGRYEQGPSLVLKPSSSLAPAVLQHGGRPSVDPEDKFYCTLCGSDTVFTNQEAYLKHKKDHRDMKKKEFQCSICEKSFSSIWNLTNHAKMHTGEKNYVCGDCGKRFITDNMLQQHQAKNCKKVPCKYTCHCGDKFHSVDSLEIHVKKNHIDGSVSKIFRCYVCNDQFLQAFELDQHVKDNHPVDYAEFMQHKADKAQAEAGTGDFTQEDAGEDEEQEPLYPEVLMACNSDDDEECNTTAEKLGADDSNGSNNAVAESSSDVNQEIVEDGGGGGWNFIPGLTGDAEPNDDEEGTSDSDQYEDEIDPASFEPEDVEVPVSTLVESYPHLSLSVASTSASGSPKKRAWRLPDADDDWVPSTSTQGNNSNSSAPTKRKRVHHGDGKFQCGYCVKVSHRIAYIKSHSTSMHPNLPFKFINLEVQKEKEAAAQFSADVRQNIRKILSKRPTPDITTTENAPSTSATITYPVRPFRYVLPQQAPVATISPLTQPMSQPPTTSISPGSRRNSNDGNGNKQRPLPTCSCAFEDTALGHLKRCTGDTCACYTRYKGCSETCDCRRACGNPYIRGGIAPGPAPTATTLIETMTLSAGANLQGGQMVASGLSGPNRTVYASHTLQDVVNGMIESMMGKNLPNTSATGSNGDSVRIQSSFMSSGIGQEFQQQKRTLGNVTGYANPISYENFNTTTTTNSPELSAALSSPIANVPPSQTFSVNYGIPIASSSTSTSQLATSATKLNPTYSPHSRQFSVQVSSNPNQGTAVVNQSLPYFSSSSTSTFQNQPQSVDTSKIYRCFCHQDFNTLSSFLLHQWHHKEEKLFLCPICKMKFASVNNLILHARNHTEIENIAMIPCSACDRLMADKTELDRHFTTCHATLICGVCDHYCSSTGDLSSHRLTHGVCNICGLTFYNQTAMRNHLARDHPNLGSEEVVIRPLPSTSTSTGHFSDTRQQLRSTTVSNRGASDPEVVTIIDLEDEDVRPPSPEVPQIVSVTGTPFQGNFDGSGRSQEFGYFGFNN